MRPNELDASADAAAIEDLGRVDDVMKGADVVTPPVDVPAPPGDVKQPPEDLPSPIDDLPSPIDDLPSPIDDLPSPIDDVVRPADVVRPTDVPGTCVAPLQPPLALPLDTRMGTTAGRGLLSGACVGTNGPEAVFPVVVTERTGLQLDTGGSSFDTVLYVRRRCESAEGQVACNDDVPGSNNAFVRTELDPGSYVVVVDTYGDGAGGNFTLRARTFTPAPNATCASAMTVAPGSSVRGDTLGGGAAGTACEGSAWGPQLHYTVTVPAMRAVSLNATPRSPGWGAVIRVRSDCSAMSCLASARSASEGTAAVARYENRSAQPVTLQVAVASTTGRVGGAVSLTATLGDLTAAPSDAVCATPTALASGARRTGERLDGASERLGGACVPAAQGASRFYRVSVPGRATLLATATGRDGLDPALRLLDACGATACLASASATGANARETLTWSNPGDATRTVILAAGSATASPEGVYDLAVDIAPAPTNTACARATALMGTAQLTLQNAARGEENVTSACLDGATGTALFYAVTVPPGQTLSARATPYAGMDPVLRVLPACGATTCLASANASAAGAPESLAWTNASMVAARVILAVGGASNATNGLFDLDLSVAREYREAAIPTACDDLRGAAALPGVTGDDSVTAARDLPFPFTFYGARQLEYTVSSNGLMQLFPSLPATGSSAFENAPIPSSAAPSGFIAAFWDDLFPLAMTSVIRASTLGTAPSRRFVVEWSALSHYADRMARLSFQAKLFEGSGVIELHHCALTPGMTPALVTGSSATVGIEAPDGRSGVQHSHQRAMAVSTTSAIRFTP